MHESIRKGLVESYKHRSIEGHCCSACGRFKVPLALHVIEYSHPENVRTPANLVSMSQSRGVARGSVPLCTKCCPACKKCSLPIATRSIKKIVAALNASHGDVGFRVGNGYCKHIHVLNDIRSLFCSPKLAVITEVKNKATTSSPQNRIKTPKKTLRPKTSVMQSTPEQIGYLLSLLLTNATTSKGATLMSEALQYDIANSSEKENKLIRELAPLNTCHLIMAASASYSEAISGRVIKSFLASAKVTLFEHIESGCQDFPALYQQRLDSYYRAFYSKHPPTAVTHAFMRNFGMDPKSQPETASRVSSSIAAFFNSAMGMLKEQSVKADA